MSIPQQQYADAHAELDGIGNAVAAGAQVAPDLVMRIVIAMRERLDRHKPSPVDDRLCAHDGQRWPCAEAAGDLAVLGIRPAEEYL